MKYIVTLNGKNYEVEVEKGEAVVTNVTAAPPQQVVAPATAAPAPTPIAAVSAPAPASAEPLAPGEVVKAPMPGTILSVKCNPGISVKAGDVVMILEAMKMENEIAAPKDGVIKQIAISQGAQVNTGDVLFVIA